ncbi:hypothetical protein FRB99_004908 [Tulasnella sp. 403]|nr:hypothetical protein FRB99_004908 [Tulasnella sp. 403]
MSPKKVLMSTPNPDFAVDPLFGPDATGDCVLQSSDAYQFKAYRLVLSIASPFFRDMFNLPQQSPSEPGASSVITVAEDGETVQALLLTIYPSQLTRIETVELAIKLAVAWDKYLLSPDLLHGTLRLTIYSNKELPQDMALKLFGLAHRLGMDAEARLASRYTHNVSLTDDKAGMLFQLTGSMQALLDLQAFRLKREEALNSVVMALLGHNNLCPEHGGLFDVEKTRDIRPHYRILEAIKLEAREALKTPFPAEKCYKPLLFFGISKEIISAITVYPQEVGCTPD